MMLPGKLWREIVFYRKFSSWDQKVYRAIFGDGETFFNGFSSWCFVL